MENNDNDKENNSLEILDEINKGATMGMDAINYVLDKVSDNDFKEVLHIEHDKYQKISDRVKQLYSNYESLDMLDKTTTMTKMMTWYGVQMKTITDSSTSKLAELLMQGTNMGIIKGRRLINENKETTHDIKNILNDFVVMQEDSVETLKKYL